MGMAATNQLVGVPLIDINLNIDTFYSKRLKRGLDIFLSLMVLFYFLHFGFTYDNNKNRFKRPYFLHTRKMW